MRYHHKCGKSRAAEQTPARSVVERAMAPAAPGRLSGFGQSSNVVRWNLLQRMMPSPPQGAHASFLLSRQSKSTSWPHSSFSKAPKLFRRSIGDDSFQGFFSPRSKAQLGFSLPRGVSIPLPHSHTKEYLYQDFQFYLSGNADFILDDHDHRHTGTVCTTWEDHAASGNTPMEKLSSSVVAPR